MMSIRSTQKYSFGLVGLVLAVGVVVSACGSSGSSSGVVGSTGTSGSATVTSYISKGPISGANCYLYNAANQLLAGPVQSANGVATFTGVSLPSNYGVVMAQCSGGTYTDEATGAQKTASTLRGAAIPNSTTSATVVITPFTEIAARKSAANLSDFADQAANVATAVGIPDVNITSTIPTDLNTTAALNNDPGKYGIALAALSQAIKDGTVGTSLPGAISNLNVAITGGTIAASQGSNLRSALIALSSSPVSARLDNTQVNNQYANLANAASTPFITPNAIVVKCGSPLANCALPLVYGTNVNFSGTGGQLPATGLTATLSNGNCGTVTLTGTTGFSVDCRVPSSGASTTFTLATATATVANGSASYTMAATSSSTGGGAAISEVLPMSVNYGVPAQKFNVCGNNIPETATARLGNTNCTKISYDGSTIACRDIDRSRLTFTCDTPTNAAVTSDAFSLDVGASFALTRTVNYTSGATLTSVSPQPTPGAPAPSSWTVNGTNLHNGLTISFNGTNCTSNGTVNNTGTQLTGVNCANVTVPANTSSANLVATSGTNAPSLAINWVYWDTVSPEAAKYGETLTFILNGNNFGGVTTNQPASVTATLGDRACNAGANQTATRLQFTCTASSDRSLTSQTLQLAIPNVGYTPNKSITLTALPVVLTSASPDQINHGNAGSSNWIVNGTGLYRDTTANTGLTFSFNGTACRTHGSLSSSDGTQISGIDCSNAMAAATGSSTSLTATGTRYAGTGSTVSLAIKAADINQVNPTSVAYNSTNIFYVAGVNFPTSGITAKLGTTDCTTSGTPTSTAWQFSCKASNDRTKTSDTLTLTLPNSGVGGAGELTRTITYTAPTVSLNNVGTTTLTQGASLPTSFVVYGSGFYTGMQFNFNGSLCQDTTQGTTNQYGVANAEGTQYTLRCPGLTAPNTSTTTLTTTDPANNNTLSLSVSLSSLPVASISWADGNTKTLKVGGNSVTTSASVTNCSGSVVTYSLATNPTTGVVTQANGAIGNTGGAGGFTLTPGNTAGTATVTATASAINGVCSSSTSTYTLTVSALDPVVFSFGSSSYSIGLDSTTRTYTNTVSSTTPTTGVGYAYAVESEKGSDGNDRDIVDLDTNTGQVTIKGAGVAKIKATATATGYSSATATYTLTINKGTVQFSQPTTLSTTMGSTVQNAITVSPTQGTTPAITGGPTYTVTNGTGSATVSATGTVTPTAPGTVTINISYAGDNNYSSNSSSYSLSINRGSSSSVTMSWATSPDSPLTYWTTTTAKALATATGTTPTGQICYTSSDASVITVGDQTTKCVDKDTAVTLKAVGYGNNGSATLTAKYQQDNNYEGGAEVTKTITINKTTPTVAFLSGYTVPTTLAKGQTAANVRVKVTGTTGAGVPAGSVSFTSGATALLSVCTDSKTLSNGETTTDCAVSVPNSAANSGNVSVTATYTPASGSPYNTANASATVNVTTTAAPTLSIRDTSGTNITSTTITLSSSTATPVKLRVERPSWTTNQPGGTVTFTSSDTNVAAVCSTATVNVTWNATGGYSESADCTITLVGTGTGTATITATYSGDSNFAAGTAPTITVQRP